MSSIAGMGFLFVSKGRFTTEMFLDWKQHGPLVELELKLSTRFFTSEYSCNKVHYIDSVKYDNILTLVLLIFVVKLCPVLQTDHLASHMVYMKREQGH